MRVLPKVWMEKEFEGVVFFIQSVDEMVFNYSYDSYRAPSMNTYFRLQEGMVVLTDVISKELNRKIARPVIEEIAWSLRNDLVAREIIGLLDLEYLSNKLESQIENLDECLKLVHYIFGKIENKYMQCLSPLILKTVLEPNKKEDIYKLAQCFCSSVLGGGYGRQYIMSCLRTLFFQGKRPESPIEAAKSFIEIFDWKTKEISVFIRMSETAYQYCVDSKIFDFVAVSQDELESLSEFISRRKGMKKIIKLKLKNYDIYSARALAERRLGIIESYASTISSIKYFKWDKYMFVDDGSGSSAIISNGVDVLDKRITLPFSKRSEQFVRRVSMVNENAISSKGRRRINLSLRAFSSAFWSKNNDMKVIAIWSAFETLLPEPKNEARIETYVRNILPCISRRYVRAQIEWLFNDLKKIYKEKFINIINKVEGQDGEFEKFILILVQAEYKDTLRKEVFSLCEGNPLARYRVYRIATALSSVDGVKKFLEAHVSKVYWQIHRVYRTRNSIVHSGVSLPYVESILMNIHEYFFRVLREVEERCLAPGAFKTIDGIFDDIIIDDDLYNRHLKSFEGSSPLTKENCFKILRVY